MKNNVIQLGEELTIRQVQPMYTQVIASLSEGHPLELNTQQLNKIDTAGAQLLYLLSAFCQQRSLTLQCDLSHPDIQRQFQYLGMTLPAPMLDISKE